MSNFLISLDKTSINNYLLLLLSFFITTSIYITDLVILLLAISWVLSGDFKNKIKIAFYNPFTYPAICFFIYFSISYFWSDSGIWNNITQKQLLLLLLPILYSLRFSEKYIEKSKYAFIFGLFINILFSITTLFFPSNS